MEAMQQIKANKSVGHLSPVPYTGMMASESLSLSCYFRANHNNFIKACEWTNFGYSKKARASNNKPLFKQRLNEIIV
jgi:hypothetical protein